MPAKSFPYVRTGSFYTSVNCLFRISGQQFTELPQRDSTRSFEMSAMNFPRFIQELPIIHLSHIKGLKLSLVNCKSKTKRKKHKPK